MGLKTGAKILLNSFKPGLYNHNARQYNVYIDGELMRYKGLCDNNQANSPECIAQVAHNYMLGLVSDLEQLFKKRALGVYVYMDGVRRVKNKTMARAEYHMNTEIVRAYFKDICKNTGFPIVELDCGEAELTMYLQRDQAVDLNVFITCDSDMLSICYGHKPKLYYVDNPNETVPDNKYKYERLPRNEFIRNSNGNKVIDDNYSYCPIDENGRMYKVSDSCLWVNSLKNVECIGCDFISERLGLSPRVFRTMVCMCGTDFSNNILTESMLLGVMRASKDYLNDLNYLKTTRQIVCALLYYGLKFNGTIKRQPRNKTFENFEKTNIDTYEKNIEDYIQYISTGEMTKDEIKNMNMYEICMIYLDMMKMSECHKKRSYLQVWCISNSLSDVIRYVEYFRDALGRKTNKYRNNIKKSKANESVEGETPIKKSRGRKPKTRQNNTTASERIGISDIDELNKHDIGNNRHVMSVNINDNDDEVTTEMITDSSNADFLKELETIAITDSENDEDTEEHESAASTFFDSEEEMYRCLGHLLIPEPDFFH